MAAPADEVSAGDGTIGLGRTVDGGRPFTVAVESLRRHAVVFAGSGSGKTVLIRRLVEECAREGVSAIVLDPNNDSPGSATRGPTRRAGGAPATPNGPPTTSRTPRWWCGHPGSLRAGH
ncbi:DUF87 domain-containing protein [Micromonospora sp. M12]